MAAATASAPSSTTASTASTAVLASISAATPRPHAPRSGVTAADAACFRDHGYCAIPEILPRELALHFRALALELANRPDAASYSQRAVFQQMVNVWLYHEGLRELTFNPQLQAAVRALAGGRRMRLWHDHLLIKRPHNGVASEFHQDEPYWSVMRETFTISAWIALGDVPVERGCMSFIPDTHTQRDLRAQALEDPTDLLSLWPDLAYAPRVVCPLRAGGATFHQGFTAHRAAANETDEDRVAMSVIWVEEHAQFNGAGHPVTDDLGLAIGQTLPESRCPLVPLY